MPGAAAQLWLDAWERGRLARPWERALLLLSLACPDEPLETLAALPIGQRDGRLLDLRERCFGARLDSVVDCPACGAPLEFECPIQPLRPEAKAGREALRLDADDWHLRFRLPTTADVAAVAEAGTGEAARHLLARCVLDVDRAGQRATAADLPEPVIDAVSARMAAADPGADIRIALSCPQCAHDWESRFDIAAYLWLELDSWARRTLEDVHRLASAYGWREADILAMSGARRQAYLELGGR